MKLHIILTLLIGLICLPVQSRTVDFDEQETIQSPTDEANITLPGSWFLRDSGNLFQKKIDNITFELYPDQSDRTEQVIDDQASVWDSIDTYIKEGIQSGNIEIKGDIDLIDVESITYYSACLEDAEFCKFFTRQNNKDVMITVFPDQSDETPEATLARVNVMLKLSLIALAANDGNFWVRK